MATKFKQVYESTTLSEDSTVVYQLLIKANFRLRALTHEEQEELDRALDKVEELVKKFKRSWVHRKVKP